MKLRGDQLPMLFEARLSLEAGHPATEPDGDCRGWLSLFTTEAAFPLTITVQLTDDEAERSREDRYDAMRLARVQKRLEEEKENVARHKAKVERHAEFLLERGLASRVWTNEPEWRAEELDGTFLHLSYTPRIWTLVALERSVDQEGEDGEYDRIREAILRVLHLRAEMDDPDADTCDSELTLPEDADEPMGILAREHAHVRDGTEAAAALVPALVGPARLIEAGKLFERARFNIERVEKLYRRREGGERPRPA